MKLAYIANSRFPSEKARSDQMMAMCSAFAAQGNEVTLLVPDRGPIVAEDPFTHYGRPKTFTIERVPCVDTLRFSWLGTLGFWIQSFTFFWQAARRVRRLRPDVIYSRDLYFFWWPTGLAKRVWESHDLPRSGFARPLLRRLSGIVTLTSASRDRLVTFGVALERISVESDAVDPNLFHETPPREEARKALKIFPEECVCLYTGKFTTMGMPKGLDEAIEAVQKLRAQGISIRLMAVGGTKDELVRYASKAGEGVELMGHQPQRELKRFYAAADVLLMPFPWTEHYAYFMSPLKLFEYLFSGVPMIVTDLPSVREIVSEKEAFFAKPGDVPSLVTALESVMRSGEEGTRRAAAARQMGGRYTWQARAERITKFFHHPGKAGLLIVTQVMDETDTNLSFFVQWVRKLAEGGQPVHVACWQKGVLRNLPANVFVHVMPSGALARTIELKRLSWRLRHDVRSVFVHMIAPVVVALGLWWRCLGWRICLWHTHGSVHWTLQVASWFTHVILTATSDSCRLDTPKKMVVGHGIDFDIFRPSKDTRKSVLLSGGRITLRKDYGSVLLLTQMIHEREPNLVFETVVFGEPRLPADRAYQAALQDEAKERGIENYVRFVGAKLGEDLVHLYQAASLFISTSRTGSLDKTVLESLACETPVLTVDGLYQHLPTVHVASAVWDETSIKFAVDHLYHPASSAEARQGVRKIADIDTLAQRLRSILFL